jgi:hypothetical protein
LFLVGKPTERGFFCDDESLRHPYNSNTVTDPMLYAYGFLVPIIAIVIVETIGRSRIPKMGSVQVRIVWALGRFVSGRFTPRRRRR